MAEIDNYPSLAQALISCTSHGDGTATVSVRFPNLEDAQMLNSALVEQRERDQSPQFEKLLEEYSYQDFMISIWQNEDGYFYRIAGRKGWPGQGIRDAVGKTLADARQEADADADRIAARRKVKAQQ
jgi:hypothetical protein